MREDEGVEGQRLILLDSDQVNKKIGVSDELTRRGGRIVIVMAQGS
jgi:hypothetical protein